MLYFNECLFILQSLFLGCATLCALRVGKEATAALTAVLVVLVNIFVRKQILLGGLEATASDALAIGITFNLNLLLEYYGKNVARKAIFISFFCAVIYACLSQLHLGYTPSPGDSMQEYYRKLLQETPRLIFASIFSFLVSSYMDYTIFRILQKKLGNRFLILRNYSSIGISHGIDTLLFGFLGLYGLVTNLGQIMLISYIVKLIALACTTPFTWLSKKIIPVRQP